MARHMTYFALSASTSCGSKKVAPTRRKIIAFVPASIPHIFTPRRHQHPPASKHILVTDTIMPTILFTSLAAAKRCPRVVCPKASQFEQVLLSAKLHLCWCCRPLRLYPSFVVSAQLPKDGSQSLISTKNGIRHKKIADTRKGFISFDRLRNAGTRKKAGTRKMLTLEEC
jgi:hypothetical protein